MIGEWWIGNDMEGSGHGLIWLEGPKSTTEDLSQDSWSLGWDLNREPTEYKAGVLTIGLQRSVNMHVIRTVSHFWSEYDLLSFSKHRHVEKMYLFVFSDLLQNPLIVPLKRLSNHESCNDFGIFDVIFHPTQPWVFSSGADKTIRLYTWHHSDHKCTR
jgi:hypothetical protein